MNGKVPDLVGQRFGRLTVLERAEDHINPNGSHSSMWLCLCDCGNNKIVRACSLLNGDTRSCGCYARECSSKIKPNKYIDCGDYYIGIDYNGKEFYFDSCNYDKIKSLRWYIDSHGYVRALRFGKKYYLHRYIFDEIPDNKIIDHIDTHKRNDCRRRNLRYVTPSENVMNRTISSNNTSGVTGVSFNKRRNKWNAYITINYKKINLGNYENFDDAVDARKEAEEKYFGEYSYDNSLKTNTDD